MPNYFQALPRAFQNEWPSIAHPEWRLNNDGNRYFWVTDNQGREVAKWECRPFPNCAALVVTTQFVVHEEMRNQGIGRALRDLQLRAYKAAGFTGEIATVRSDNAAQVTMMLGMGYRKMETFGSPYGGTVDLWLKRFDAAQPVPVAAPLTRPPTPWYYAAPPVPAPVVIAPPPARPDAHMWRGYVAPPEPEVVAGHSLEDHTNGCTERCPAEKTIYSHQKKV